MMRAQFLEQMTAKGYAATFQLCAFADALELAGLAPWAAPAPAPAPPPPKPAASAAECPRCGSKRVALTCLECEPAPAPLDGEFLRPVGRRVPLLLCPPGLFSHDSRLGYRTEYSNNDGKADAYCFESGEFFWGGTVDPKAQGEIMVQPFALASRPPLPAPPSLERLAAELYADDRRRHGDDERDYRWEDLHPRAQEDFLALAAVAAKLLRPDLQPKEPGALLTPPGDPKP